MQRANHHQVSSNVLFTRWFCTDLYETIEHGPRNIYFKYYFTRTKVVRHIEISIFNFCFSFPATYQILRSVITGVVAWCNRVAAGTRATLKRRFTYLYEHVCEMLSCARDCSILVRILLLCTLHGKRFVSVTASCRTTRNAYGTSDTRDIILIRTRGTTTYVAKIAVYYSHRSAQQWYYYHRSMWYWYILIFQTSAVYHKKKKLGPKKGKL